MTKSKIDVDAEVARYLQLAEEIEARTGEQTAIKDRLRSVGVGKHETSFGINVTVSPPSRSFDLARAWAALTPEQQELCTSPDAKKVKAQLPGVLIESLMVPGKGDPAVKIG